MGTAYAWNKQSISYNDDYGLWLVAIVKGLRAISMLTASYWIHKGNIES